MKVGLSERSLPNKLQVSSAVGTVARRYIRTVHGSDTQCGRSRFALGCVCGRQSAACLNAKIDTAHSISRSKGAAVAGKGVGKLSVNGIWVRSSCRILE